MSFSAEVKEELSRKSSNDCCYLSELSALLRSNGEILLSNSSLEIDYHTQNATIAKRVVKLLKNCYSISIDLFTKKQVTLDKKKIYIVIVKERAKEIVEDLKLLDQLQKKNNIPLELTEKNCCKRAYLRGVFMACGSISNPQTSNYHLELNLKSLEHAKEITDLINVQKLNAKIIERKKNYMIYIKQSENISDFLKIIEAYNSVMFFEDVRIYKDIKNSINRVDNCEIANQKKILLSAKKQFDEILFIEKRTGLDVLGDKLLEAATIRLKNPEASINELTLVYETMYEKKISKSGLNHRYRKIREWVSKLKEQ